MHKTRILFMYEKRDAINIAKELHYSNNVIRKLKEANSSAELTNIMSLARRELLK